MQSQTKKLIPYKQEPLPHDRYGIITFILMVLSTLPYFFNLYGYDGYMPYYKGFTLAAIVLLFPVVWMFGRMYLSKALFYSVITFYVAVVFVLGGFLGTEMDPFVYQTANLVAFMSASYLWMKHEKHRRHKKEQEVFN
jgi:hypothetical protein